MMRMDPFIIQLIQGLVENTEAKVHVNGLFIQSFPLEREVRKRYLLSSFLFFLIVIAPHEIDGGYEA